MIFVLDSSAILRYLDREAGFDRVRELIRSHRLHKDNIAISAIQWGEIARMLYKRHPELKTTQALAGLRRLNFDLVPVTDSRAERAAKIRVEKNIHYADAIAAELAASCEGAILVTADFDFAKVSGDITVEFLPAKHKL